MKLIVAGGRDFNDYELLKTKLDFFLKNVDKRDLILISGCAKGADSLGERYAHMNLIELWKFPADWRTHGNRAGPIRNKEMADNATHLIAFWDGKSKGTKNMIETATKMGLGVRVVRYEL